jgi:hypothetical protein
VAELSHGAGLAQESFPHNRVEGQLAAHNLNGHFSLQARLVGFVNNRHTARADLFRYFILAQRLANQV